MQKSGNQKGCAILHSHPQQAVLNDLACRG
nr:MAG TPA: MPN family protein [Caudoviricetes sp.]DAY13421.1 MAG TPA: MPN family protein [Caudoviricetes sp.]